MPVDITELSVRLADGSEVSDGDTIVIGEDQMEYHVSGVATQDFSDDPLQVSLRGAQNGFFSITEGESFEITSPITADSLSFGPWDVEVDISPMFSVGPSITETITVEVVEDEPTPSPDPPDESALVAVLSSIDSPEPEVVEVTWGVENDILSGTGERISTTAELELDGEVVEDVFVNLGGGESEMFTTVLEDVPSGEVEVCVKLD